MGKTLRKCNLSGMSSLFDRNKKSRVGKIVCNICENYFFGTSAYVILLGLIGTVITGFDIIRIMNSKVPLRCTNRQRGGDVVPIDVERDLKLMTSILGIEHYTLIMLGAITEYPMLHTPWLLMQLCVILVEIIVFFVRLFLDGLHVKRDEILLAFLAVHNWLQIMELFYVSLMCLVANFLSSIALEVGTRLPLGQTASAIKSASFPTLFLRTYNLKVKLLISNIVSGCISTTLVLLGKQSGIPYLYLPWLVNTLRGIAFCEGPTLLGLAYMLLPESDVPARSFIFITLLLYVEEIFLWEKILSSFRHSWIKYSKKNRLAYSKNVKYPNANSKTTRSSTSSECLLENIRVNNNSQSYRSHFRNRTV